MASLVLKPTISASATILGYETHVKYLFRSQGCDPEEYNTPFLSQVRTGIKKSFPQLGDKRTALLLPVYIKEMNTKSTSMKKQKLRMATILAFIGMLRPHVFQELGPDSFVIVMKNERQVPLLGISGPAQQHLIENRSTILGFYIKFRSKTMNDARAYYPNLSSLSGATSGMCPVETLLHLWKLREIKQRFLASLGRGAHLEKYLREITGSSKPVAPYALRIGGRTWYLSQGLDRLFVDYLGTWSSPEASARYFRARPAAVLAMVLRFYANTKIAVRVKWHPVVAWESIASNP